MVEANPWEQSPDESYWNALLGTPEIAPPQDTNVPQHPPANPPVNGWELAEKSYSLGDILQLRVVGCNRGGLLVDLGGLHGFVPASQLVSFPRNLTEEARAEELARYVNTTVRAKVIEFDRARNRLILSERIVNPPVSRADQLLAAIQPEQTREGTVRNITDFGAFIDLGGIEGLIHVSELSWEYVRHPSDVLTPGQQVQVYVLDVNREQRRIACSIKRLKPNPWQELAATLHPGDWIEGTITSIVPFGAFIRLPNGVEGLAHASQLAEGNFLHPHDVVSEGQHVRARVMEIDILHKRLRLSLRATDSSTDADGNGESIIPPPPDPGYWASLADM